LKPEILKKQAAGRRTADWFVLSTKFHNWLRDTFLNITNLSGFAPLMGWFFAPSLKSMIRD
jgi:hypothetical protein